MTACGPPSPPLPLFRDPSARLPKHAFSRFSYAPHKGVGHRASTFVAMRTRQEISRVRFPSPKIAYHLINIKQKCKISSIEKVFYIARAAFCPCCPVRCPVAPHIVDIKQKCKISSIEKVFHIARAVFCRYCPVRCPVAPLYGTSRFPRFSGWRRSRDIFDHGGRSGWSAGRGEETLAFPGEFSELAVRCAGGA